MINSVNNIFNNLPDWRSIPSVKQGIAKTAQSAFSMLKDQVPHLAPGLLALGYDIGMGNPVGNSVTVGLAAGSFLNYKFDVGTRLTQLAAFLGRKRGVQAYFSLGLPIDLQDKNGRTLLHLASLTGDLEMVRCLVEKGANPHLETKGGDTAFSLAKNVETLRALPGLESAVTQPGKSEWTLLHQASSLGDLDMVQLLVEKGANPHLETNWGATAFSVAKNVEILRALPGLEPVIDRQDKDGWTLLHSASIRGDLDKVRFLLEKGANPHLKTKAESTAFCLAKSVPMLLLLLGAETHPAFVGCKTIHDVYEVLFPPCLYKIPDNSEELIAKLPSQSLLIELEEEHKRLEGQKFSSIEEMAQELKIKEGAVVPIGQVLNILLQHNPLFAKAWELANRLGWLAVKEGEDTDFKSTDGTSTFSSGKGAKYNHNEHLITIHKNESFESKIESLVFETINALQRKSFQASHALAKCGQVNREEHAFLTEFIEDNSDAWRQNICASMGILLEKHGWASTNIPYRGATRSHTDDYRRRWDASYAAPYFASHPEFLKKRLLELEKGEEKKSIPPSALAELLKFAVRGGQPQIVEQLLAQGADPFAHPLPIEDLQMVQKLTGMDKERAFLSCKSIGDFFSVLLPHSVVMPSNWRQILKKIPGPRSAAKALSRKYQQFLKQTPQEQQKVQLHVNEPNRWAEELEKVSPLFACVWKWANQSGPIRVEIRNVSNWEARLGLYYDAEQHLIQVPGTGTIEERLEAFMLGVVKAIHRDSSRELSRLRELGAFSREEYVLLNLNLLRFRFSWAAKLLKSMGHSSSPQKYREISEEWKKPWPVESFQISWDYYYSHRYFAAHPEFLPQRKRELADKQADIEQWIEEAGWIL